MKVRLSEIVFVLICLVMLAFGTILLIKADDTPVPGMLMVGIAIMALIWRYRGDRHPRRVVTDEDADEYEHYESPGKWDMEIYEQQAERRRRGESDV